MLSRLSGEFVALGYEDGSVGFWQLPAPLHAQQRRLGVPGPALAMPPLSGPASMSLKRHAHSGKVVALSALQRSSPTFALALLASAGDEGTVWLWDLLSATRLASFGPLPAEASAPSALGTALLARPGGAHGEVALCIGRPRGQLRLHLLAEEGQPRQPEQWEKVGLGDVRAGLGDARGAAGGGLEDAAEGNHVGFRAEEKVISPPVADVHSAPLRLVHVALSDDGRFAAALYSPRAASAAGSGRSASADGDGEVLRVFGLAEAGLVRTWQVSDGDGDELHGERVLSVCWGTPKVHGGSLPLHACLSSGRLLHWEVGSRNGHLLLEQLRTSGRQSSSLPALALSPSRRGGASGRSSHLADIPLTGAERGRAQRSRVGSAPGSPARQASGQPSHASARHGVASVSGVDWLGSEGSHSHRYAGARHAGGGPYGEVSSLPLTAHGSEASSPALARARAAAGRRSGTDFGGGYGAGHGGGYASEGEAEDGEGSEMRSRDGGAHPAAHSRSFLRSESMLSGWADATPADRNADRSADHAADGEPAAAQPRPQQARTGARPTSQPPANFGDFPLAGVSAANALASAHLHSSAALESELAALYEQLQHDRDGQAGLLLHTQAVGGGGGEAAPADGMRKDASAHRRTSPARTRSPRGLALKSSQASDTRTHISAHAHMHARMHTHAHARTHARAATAQRSMPSNCARSHSACLIPWLRACRADCAGAQHEQGSLALWRSASAIRGGGGRAGRRRLGRSARAPGSARGAVRQAGHATRPTNVFECGGARAAQ